MTTCGDLVKEIKEFRKKCAVQSANDGRDSTGTAASFASGSEAV